MQSVLFCARNNVIILIFFSIKIFHEGFLFVGMTKKIAEKTVIIRNDLLEKKLKLKFYDISTYVKSSV